MSDSIESDVFFRFEEKPQIETIQQFEAFLDNHSREKVGYSDHSPLSLWARDKAGNLLGGLTGVTNQGYLFVEGLAVAPSERGKRLGSLLLQQAESEARNRGCHTACLYTFDFQARPFYEKNGYNVFGTLSDSQSSPQVYFLQKRLIREADNKPKANS